MRYEPKDATIGLSSLGGPLGKKYVDSLILNASGPGIATITVIGPLTLVRQISTKKWK